VNAYTIAITCEGYNAQMILKIDDSSGTPRINELSVRPTEGNSLSAQDMPNVDLDLLLRSLPGAGASPTRPAGLLGGAEEPDEPPASGAVPAQVRPAARVEATPARGAKKASRAVATKQAAGAAERQRSRKAAAVGGARAYRRMPDDLAAVYAESGSVTAVARHYGVPRHTAQGWIGRLRRQD
jgi:hypothetical protein